MCHVEDHSVTIRFFHSLLKNPGKPLIDIKSHLDNLGLKFDEVTAPNSFDITDCFNRDSKLEELLLDFMTGDFTGPSPQRCRKASWTCPGSSAALQKDGRAMFNNDLSCMLVFA
ncbi:unnamed protein product [Merluccius merluccius]